MLMSIKNGVKNFSESAQETHFDRSKEKKVSAEQWKQHFGDESLDTVLNKVTDPNWVDKGKKINSVGDNQLSKDAFFKLMLTQLKNQDPTKPMQSHEMAAQLAQFTSLEQLNNMNATLGDISQKQDPMAQFQVLNFIGKTVSGNSSNVYHSESDKEHEFGFELDKNATQVDIKVLDSSGEIVRRYELKDIESGRNQVTWDGRLDDGRKVIPGEYRFVVDAKQEDGKVLPVQTEFEGRITGVKYTPKGPVLVVGNKSVQLKDVEKIIDSSIGSTEEQKSIQSGQSTNDVTSLDLSKADGKSDNQSMNEKVNIAELEGKLALSPEMKQKLKTEGEGSQNQ